MNLRLWMNVIAASLALSVTGVMADEKSAVPTEVKSMADYEAMEKAALSGDYQAQRNLAYTLSTSIPFNPILGCAWRIVIVESGSSQVDQSDTGNKAFYCDKLSADELLAAQAQAEKLTRQMANE